MQRLTGDALRPKTTVGNEHQTSRLQPLVRLAWLQLELTPAVQHCPYPTLARRFRLPSSRLAIPARQHP